MKDIYVNRGVEKILGWPTDTFAIDWKYSDGATATRRRIHTIVLFVPGNPGLVEWYIPFFSEILKAIGPDYAIRGASYAGHSVDAQQIHVEEGKKTRPHDKSTNPTSPAGVPSTTLAWTIDGQVNHKISYLDKVLGLPEFRDARLIFIGHSIGCHLVKRMLLVRADFLSRTTQCIFLMPFIRMDAPTPHQQFLDWASKNPDTSDTILHTLSRVLSTLSPPMLESLLQSMMEKKEDREFTAKLIRQTRFPRNFLGLGLEEIRDVPQTIDVSCVAFVYFKQIISSLYWVLFRQTKNETFSDLLFDRFLG